MTGKFAEAAQAGAIPIYWGDPAIGNYFNSKAFINCHDYESLDAAVARVIEIDQDDDLYRKMLNEPWFLNENEPTTLSNSAIKSFLNNIFDQPHPPCKTMITSVGGPCATSPGSSELKHGKEPEIKLPDNNRGTAAREMKTSRSRNGWQPEAHCAAPGH